MKKIYAAVIFVLIGSCKINGQQYFPFPDSNAVWTEHTMACFGTCTPQPINPLCIEMDFAYYLQGDTLINSISYHAIYQTGYSHEYCLQGGTVNNWYYINNVYAGAYRQDTALKKVYFVDAAGSPECLLYDFNLNIGDTLQGGCFNWYASSNDCLILTGIDSILIGNNYRKRYTFLQSFSFPVIEGIGSIGGLLEPICPFEYSGTLLCFSQNGLPLYPDTITPCVIPSGIDESAQPKFPFSISPNPFTDELTITTSHPTAKAQIKIQDIYGRLVYQQNEQTFPKFKTLEKLNLAHLKQGVYFVEVITDKGRVVKKIVKQ